MLVLLTISVEKKEWENIRDIKEFCVELDRQSARYIEQAVIDTFGRRHNQTGILNNIRNSIGERNNIHKGYIDFFNNIWN